MITTDVSSLIKFEPKLIEVTERPRIIIGEKPGKTRDKSRYALVGNRTGDFVAEAIGNRKNIILTNVTNILYPGKFDKSRYLDIGIIDLLQLFEKYDPIKIICLGEYAFEYASAIWRPDDCSIWSMRHPSYINRFHYSDRQIYINQLSHELDK